MTAELFLAILPGLILVAVGLVGAGMLLPSTIHAAQEKRDKKRTLAKLSEQSKTTIGDVVDAMETFEDAYNTARGRGHDADRALFDAFASVVAEARATKRKEGAK